MNDTAPVAGKNERWKTIRKAAMKTQQDVATETGIALPTIVAVETGARNFGLKNAIKFIKACQGNEAARRYLDQETWNIAKECGI